MFQIIFAFKWIIFWHLRKIQSISGEILWASGDQGIGAILLSMKIILTRHTCKWKKIRSGRKKREKCSFLSNKIWKFVPQKMHNHQTFPTYQTGFFPSKIWALCNCVVRFAEARKLVSIEASVGEFTLLGLQQKDLPLTPQRHRLFFFQIWIKVRRTGLIKPSQSLAVRFSWGTK